MISEVPRWLGQNPLTRTKGYRKIFGSLYITYIVFKMGDNLMINIRKHKIIMLAVIIAFTMLSLTTTAFAQDNILTPSGIKSDDLESQIDAYLAKHIGQTLPGAAICVVKDGKVVLEKGYGYADIESQTPVNVQNTAFEYGSISKLFVWTSAMQLVEQGKLKLDEDIRTYLPSEITSKLKFQHPITMYDLMSHTAGFEQQAYDWKPFPLDPPNTPLEVSLVKHQPKQVYLPKTVIAYSNYGAAIAGLVVEQISGKRFYDYEREYIFNPLGMEMITGNPTLSDSPNLVKIKSKGYVSTGKGQFKQGTWTFLSEYPAGSVNGTIQSLSKYLIALTPEKSQGTTLFTQKSTLEQMLAQSYTPHSNMPSIAHGFWEYYGAERSLWHSGNTASFSSFFAFVPEERFGFAILTNAGGAFDEVHGFGELLLGQFKKYDSEQKTTLPLSKNIAGKYMISMYSHTSFFELLSYLTEMVNIDAVGDKEIEVQMKGKTTRYVQVSPYLYELSSQANPETNFNHSYLNFELNDGKVQRISGGHFMDMIPLPQGRTIPYLWFSIVVVIAASLFFTITPIVLLVQYIRRENKTADLSKSSLLAYKFTTALVLLGTLLILNNATLLFSAAFVTLLSPLQVKIQIIINCIVLFVAIVLLIYRVYRHRHFEITKKQNRFAILTLFMFVLTVYLLCDWNFFILF